MSKNFIFITVLVLISIIVLIFFNKKNITKENNKNLYNYKQKQLMTNNEFDFFNRLIKAFPEFYIFSQISMGAILEATKEEKISQAGRNTFNKKIIDFIIYGNNKIIAIIELDDKTHNKEKDEKRDSMLLEAGYKLYRFESRKKPSIEELKKIIEI